MLYATRDGHEVNTSYSFRTPGGHLAVAQDRVKRVRLFPPGGRAEAQGGEVGGSAAGAGTAKRSSFGTPDGREESISRLQEAPRLRHRRPHPRDAELERG